MFHVPHCPVPWVKTNQVHSLYSLRWQIELLFKTWKSTFNINQIKKSIFSA
ncbi:transposase [Enterococcus faecium]|uniref:transposase n=1 Tax=Enterococcus TaxID=1350 RepID=UPI002E998C35|nr:transposase [Enterococcus faecium]